MPKNANPIRNVRLVSSFNDVFCSVIDLTVYLNPKISKNFLRVLFFVLHILGYARAAGKFQLKGG